MRRRKAIRAIERDPNLLKLAEEIKAIQGSNLNNPGKIHQKMSQYRAELSKKNIISPKQLENPDNKIIFERYIQPINERNIFQRILRKIYR